MIDFKMKKIQNKKIEKMYIFRNNSSFIFYLNDIIIL